MDEVKWCFVPTCLNSTKNTVNKWFVPIPLNPKRRESWFQAVNRNYCVNSERSTLYCCSDHFNLDEDACSFFERNGEVVVKLKKSIVPRIYKSGTKGSDPQTPKRTIHLTGKAGPVAPSPSIEISKSSTELPSQVDSLSSDDDNGSLDVVEVFTSDSPKKGLFDLKGISPILAGSKKAENKTPTKQPLESNEPCKEKSPNKKFKSLSTKDIGEVTKTTMIVPTTSGSPKKTTPASPQKTTSALLKKSMLDKRTKTNEAVKSLFAVLRKSIPCLSSQQPLTREQILDEAIEFIIQMRNKSDKRQGSMHFIMENNAALTAKIKHLEQLISLHERNDLVLSKEVINRRLGAVTAASIGRLNKMKSKR